MELENYNSEIETLVELIQGIIKQSKSQITQNINTQMLGVYWEIGKHIIDLETENNIDNQSSRLLINSLSKKLTFKLGKGYNRSNLTYMRLFYLSYKAGVTVSHQLTWSHYIELLKTDNELERSFYEKQAVHERWSVRELRRQRNSALFQRLALSKDKEGVMKLAEEGQVITQKTDLIKDPYILEFLDLPEEERYSEQDLEKRIIDNLQQFLLELGKGFAFIGSQYRITLNNRHYYVDLVFYHRILKCFVLIDLKIGEAKHEHIGQMNMYLNYFNEEENMTDDNSPIGIILVAAKDEIMVKYATGGLSSNIFVSKYQTYLPDKQLLEQKLRMILEQKDKK
jgi:predicted nuclease of restriction endonuclease-like (RecB) superfamily